MLLALDLVDNEFHMQQGSAEIAVGSPLRPAATRPASLCKARTKREAVECAP